MTEPATASGHPLVIGAELPTLHRTYTAERWAWGEIAISAAAGDEDRSYRPERSIHSDESFASAQGLPARIASGALLVNWISSQLVRHFGIGYIGQGALRVKFVRPVLQGDRVEVHLRVRTLEADPGGTTTCGLDVWLDASSSGSACVVGEAIARVPDGP